MTHKFYKFAPENRAPSLHSLWLVLILLPVMFLVSALFFAVYSILSNTEISMLDQPLPIALSIMISLLVSYCIILALAHKFLPQVSLTVKQLLDFRNQKPSLLLFWCFAGAGIGVCCALFFNALSQQFPPSDEFRTSVSSALSYQGLPFFLTILSTVIIAPITEEILFRGFVFTDIRQRVIVKKINTPSKNSSFSETWLATIVATSVSALVFMGVHLLEYYEYWVSICAVLSLGFVLALLRHASRSLLAPIIAHSAYNLAIIVSV